MPKVKCVELTEKEKVRFGNSLLKTADMIINLAVRHAKKYGLSVSQLRLHIYRLTLGYVVGLLRIISERDTMAMKDLKRRMENEG
ncbi:hypothetical protein DRO54_06665 [Candidatus Bathyarchaeota archaeon]|nr:MAG: hypothetical protein DRO54_06665 [Candidatus Bathyarchaeota archaeon]